MRLLASTSILLGCVSLLLEDVNAIRIYGKRKETSWPSLGRRATLASDLHNDGDINYYANVTLNGKVFSALLDTGSSDLTVGGSVPNAGSTGQTANVVYAIGSVSGPIQTAEIDFEGFTIQNQAFLLDTTGNQGDGQGTLGIGPSSASQVRTVMKNSAGDPVLDNIFRTNTSTPNYITILLGRTNDPTDPFQGEFTVGDVITDYANITSQPKLPVTDVASSTGQHWQALTDDYGVYGPDGQPIQITTKVKGVSDPKKLTVIFDTGFTLPQVPQAIADAFYARVPGAALQNVTGISGAIYTLPCDVELNVTFSFGGIKIPIHPLDTSLSTLGKTDDLGNPICIGAFQPISGRAVSSSYDMILGMAFLRNAYILIDFGDFVDGSNSKTADPYIQLLPMSTNSEEVHNDFVQSRLDGIDNTANFQLLPASVLPPTSTDNSTSSPSLWQKVKPYLPYIIAGSSVAGVILLIAIGFCVRDRRRRRYRPLHDPAPAGLHHGREPPFAQYQPQRRY